MRKAIIDTNIWISALMKSSLTLPLLEAFMESRFIPVISDDLLDEFRNACRKIKVMPRIKFEEARELAKLIADRSVRHNPLTRVTACRDQGDNFILSLSLETGATVVSLDKDLLVLSDRFDIITPGEFIFSLNS